MQQESLELLDKLEESFLGFLGIFLLIRVIDNNNHKDDPYHLHFVHQEIPANIIKKVIAERVIAEKPDDLLEGLDGVLFNLGIFGLHEGGMGINDLQNFGVGESELIFCHVVEDISQPFEQKPVIYLSVHQA